MYVLEAVGTRKTIIQAGNLEDMNVIAITFEVQEVPHVEYELVKKPASTTDWSFMGTQVAEYHSTRKQWVVVEQREATDEESGEYWNEIFTLNM